MSRTVFCQVLQRESEGLDFPPHPGPLGQRIYENVSREAWQRWLAHLTVLINDSGLSTADPASIVVIEQHMLGFLFSEGVIRSADDVRLVEIVSPNRANVRLSRARTEILPEVLGQRRQVAMNSSCGLCGRRSLESLEVAASTLPARGAHTSCVPSR